MHGLSAMHKLNDEEAKRIMEEHGHDTSGWVGSEVAKQKSDEVIAACEVDVTEPYACEGCPVSQFCNRIF